MATLYTHKDKNQWLTIAYITGFLVFVIGVGFIFAQAMHSSAILYGFVIFSTVMSIGSYWWSDRIVLSMSGAKLVEFETNKELYRLVENLAITAGLPKPKINIIEIERFDDGGDQLHEDVLLVGVDMRRDQLV